VTIDYFSDDDLQKLLSLIRNQGGVTQTQTVEEETSSGTVIREMSPEASVLAKIASATPLEFMDAVGEIKVDDPVALDEDFEEVSTKLNTDEVSSVEEIPDHLLAEGTEDISGESNELIAPIDLHSEEFAFVSQHTEEARKPDLVAPTEYERTLFRSQPTPTHTLDSLSETPSETEVLAEVASEELLEAVSDKSEVPEHQAPGGEESDDDLYSIKNFSL